MRKLICGLLVMSALLWMPGAAGAEGKAYGDAPDSLKILCVGNSFTQDTMAYLPVVLRESMPETEVTVGVLHTSNATLSNHLLWIGESTKYRAFDFWRPDRNAWKRFYSDKSVTLKRALELRDWDIITIQGSYANMESDEGIEHMLAEAARLSGWLRYNAQKPFALMWLEWVGRPFGEHSADEMAQKIHNASVRAQSELDIAAVIPVGDAFQIAREDEALRKIGTGPSGNLMYRDNVHMQAGLPALLASYTAAAAILHHYGLDVERIENAVWIPTEENVVKIRANNEEGSTFTHGFPEGVTAQNVALAKKIAAESVLNWTVSRRDGNLAGPAYSAPGTAMEEQ